MTADVWGLGCIAYEMLSLNFLWETNNTNNHPKAFGEAT
jgi:hypothetical protein